MIPPFDVVLLSNGPGELSTWVRPVVAELGRYWPSARISVILAPDVNSSGREAEIARGFPGVSRVQPARHYLRFLLTGRTVEGWEWAERGVVLFLGGDQGLSAWIARRLGYPIIAYAEWQTRWPRWFDRFGLREEQVRTRSPKERFAGQYQVVGDLMADGIQPVEAEREQIRTRLKIEPHERLIGILPGSKPLKLTLGIPLFVGLAELLERERPGLRFCLPVAPGLTGSDLAHFGRPQNTDVALVGGTTCRLEHHRGEDYLVSGAGTRVLLWYGRPAYDLYSLCELVITTVGANTAELGLLGVPMVVALPTNRLSVMQAWDGLPGLLSNLPGIGPTIAAFINKRVLRRLNLLAWPNIRAGRQVVPELCQELKSADLLSPCLELLDDPERREDIRRQLQQVMDRPGAARALVQLAAAVLAEQGVAG